MNKIDFVITWVDGNDPKWLEEFYRYTSDGDSRKKRYRDWELLKYWFRSIEKFAPWVNKIYFITYGHIPEWLDLNNNKIKIIKHSDFIPEEYLPTFSSRAIDLNLHRIKELSEKFVYFNDDMFLLQPTKISDFFKKGLPCDTAILNALYLYDPNFKINRDKKLGIKYTAAINNIYVINKRFDKRKCIFRNIFKWFNFIYGKEQLRSFLVMNESGFTGLMNYHLPYSYLKKTYEEMWNIEYDLLDNTCKQRFRSEDGINNWVISYWQIAKGYFYPRSPKIGKFCGINDDANNNKYVHELVRLRKYKLLCISDEVSDHNFEFEKERLKLVFEEILPEKSSFEK